MKKTMLMYACLIIICTISFFLYPSIIDLKKSKIVFWEKAQKGANIFNNVISREDIQAAKKYGITFIRLAPDKFATSQKDFLIGNTDDYRQLISEDLAQLKKIIDICTEEKMPVVIAMLSIPGCRWKQHNHDQADLKLWTDGHFLNQAAQFWQDLAQALKDYPIVVGYNILNEPRPERAYKDTGEIYSPEDSLIHTKVKEKLFETYEFIIKKIRTVDAKTPIVLDAAANADGRAFSYLKPHSDPYVIYSFHMYEPFEYTNFATNRGQFQYPGEIAGTYWNKARLQAHMMDVIAFQKKYAIPHNRILVGEFGGHRTSKGLALYFDDLIDIFTEHKWHFAFYAFREDTWDGMDYELEASRLPASYWDDQTIVNTLRKSSHASFSVIEKALRS